MIQRVQSIYLSISIICLLFVSFGASLYRFEIKEGYFNFNSYGVQKFTSQNQLTEYQSTPYYLISISLILLILICLFSYKKLNFQLRIGRLVLLTYFVLLITLLFSSFLGEELTGTEVQSRKTGIGFYLFVIGFPFIFLANVGIKRDIKLLDSLNRLR